MGILALVAFGLWGFGGSSPVPDDSRSAALLATYNEELSRSEDLADVPELARLRSGRALFAALAGHAGARRLELGLMGNLNGFASACACSSKGRGGGLAVIGGAVRRWRSENAPTLLDIGDSLLPDRTLPAAYESLFLEKAQLLAELYGLIGVDLFCPSPTDLRAFDDVRALEAWSETAALHSVITNISGSHGRIRSTARLGDDELPIAIYSVCDPADVRFRSILERFELAALDPTLARCSLPERGMRIVVLHNVALTDCVERIDRPLERTIFVTRDRDRFRTRRHPRIRALQRGGRILRPQARGQSLSVLQFLAQADSDVSLENAARYVLRFDSAARQNHSPPEPAPAGIRFLLTAIEFGERSGDTIGTLDAVEDRLATHRTKVLQRLLADPPYEAGAVPERRRRLLARESCGSCHESEVAGWEAGPHAHALTTLLEGERKDKAEAGCIRCHLSALSRLTLDAPARTEDHPLRMRGVLSGITCVTCHGNVSPSHAEGEAADTSKGVVRAICRRCHDSINSPSFDYDSYVRKLGCCGHANR
ncbi:MAG: multiheme c-type cytochrome [Planctomycetota bacterium]